MAHAGLLTPRRKTRTVMKGHLAIGSEHPIAVQSMTKTETENVAGTIAQIKRCEALGVDIMRVAVPYERAARALPEILAASNVPIVADIHFNPRMAFLALEAGVPIVRINPGNINEPEIVTEIVDRARDLGRCLRIGVNSGSIIPREGMTVQEIEEDMVDFMVKQALHWIEFLEARKFFNFCVSIKSSDVCQTIAANRQLAAACDVPIHMGVTHAGTPDACKLKTALALGTLIAEGIGDTIRVSMVAPPEREVEYGIELLADLGLRRKRIEIIACPSCGRADVDVEEYTKRIETGLKQLNRPVTVSFLGCAVNGPGEAAEADFGIVAANKFSLVYKGRELIGKIKNDVLVEEFLAIIAREVPADTPAEPATAVQ